MVNPPSILDENRKASPVTFSRGRGGAHDNRTGKFRGGGLVSGILSADGVLPETGLACGSMTV
jgi:hypothetical protein